MTGEEGEKKGEDLDKAREIYMHLKDTPVISTGYIPSPDRIHVSPKGVVIDVPNKFFAESLSGRLKSHLVTAIKSSGLENLAFETHILEGLQIVPCVTSSRLEVTPPAQQQRLNFVGMTPPNTLETFFYEPKSPNAVAYATAQGIVNAIEGGDFAIAPVSVFLGQPGCGKSHLLHGIADRLGNKAKLWNGRDLPGVVSACYNDGGGDVAFNRLFDFPVFMIDGIQDMGSGGVKTQAGVLDRMEKMTKTTTPGCVVVSSYEAFDSAHFRSHHKPLIARLAQIQPICLTPSDAQTAVKIARFDLTDYLERKSANGTELPFEMPRDGVLDRVAEYIVERCGSSGDIVPRQVVENVRAVLHYSWTTRDFSLATAIQALSRSGYRPNKGFDPDEIIEKTAKAFGISVPDLKSKSRERRVSNPRDTAAYLIRVASGGKLPYEDIGDILGGRDYTTVIQAARRGGERAAEPKVRGLAAELGIVLPVGVTG